MRARSTRTIQDARQLLLQLPIRIAWVRQAGEIIARTAIGTLRAVRTPWHWWDGFLDGVAVAAGFTVREVLGRLETLARSLAGEQGGLAWLPYPAQ